jgi:HK97 family phage major capsid protein
MAPELGLHEIEERIAAADAEITSRGAALEKRRSELAEQGVTPATIDVDVAKELTKAQKEIDALKDDRIVLSDYRQSLVPQHQPMNRSPVASAPLRSFHKLLFNSPEYQAAGLKPERFRGNAQVGATPPIEFMSRDQAMLRMEAGLPLFSVAVATELDAGIPLDERLFPTVDILRRRITLLDLVTVGSTDTDTVVYTQQTVRTANAAETDLGVAYSESLFDFEQEEANVRDIGHFTTAHRSQIADAGQFDTLVRRQLQEDVMLRLESQMYAGNGSGVNLTGITAFSGIQSVDRDTTNETRIDAAHRAITKVRLVYREPDAIVLHPNDYQDIVFEKDQNDRHLLSGVNFAPSGAPAMSLWGKPMIPSTVATEGTGLLGYWPDATLWMRSGVSLSVSDSHDDYFIKRQVAILAEMRAAFSVTRPDAFCKINFI